MVLKSEIRDEAYFAFRRAQVNAMETNRIDCIHVSDLIKPCMRNVIYNKTRPTESMTTEDMRPLFLGQAVHNITDLGSHYGNNNHEVSLLYNWVEDKPLFGYETDDKNWHGGKKYDFMSGSIDDIIEIGGELVICDKKTTGSIDYFKYRDDKNLGPNDGHKEQINMYRVLLNKCDGRDAKWGCNIYYPTKIAEGKRELIIPIPFKLDPVEVTLKKMVERATIIKESMENKTVPGRTKCYLCDGMCPHATYCFSSD